jgi:Ca-activated chloride channel family protein
MTLVARTTLVSLVLAVGVSAAIADERAIIVLDASGSMWGQINGEPKISIARKVLGDVLNKVPKDVSLGLMAYGHREKGSCSDIELLIAPAPSAAAEIEGTAKALSPKGKTPLSEAVRQAAATLKHDEQKATVILITDGLETCNADPCAIARELKSSGVDFTTHVVGFGLSPEEGRQVACIADETGGQYFQAENAEALADALSETVAEVAEPPAPPEAPMEAAVLPEAALEAPEKVEIGKTFVVAWQGPGGEQDHIWLTDPAGDDGKGKVLRGRRVSTADFDKKQVSLIAPIRPGSYELQYQFGRGRQVIATRPIEVVEAEVSLNAPPNADIGRTVVVDWVGPGAVRDSIELFDATAKQGEGAVLQQKRLRNEDFENRKVRIVLPTEPGFYQLRYWNGEDRKVLATREIEVLAAEVSLSAPEAVDMGRTFVVDWVGPGGNRDHAQIFDPKGNNGNGRVVYAKRLANDEFDKRKVALIAPVKPGQYELRYLDGQGGSILATRPITIKATEVTIGAPDKVAAGEPFTVSWVGPGARRDSIDLVSGDAGEGKTIASARLVSGDYDGQKVKLKAPKEAGTYTLRYRNADSGSVLATRPIVVE